MKGISVLLLVLVIVQVVPLTSASDTGSLPNLCIREQWWKDSFALWVDQANGRYNVSYRIENKGDACADASNTTINITIISGNGSLSSVISDPVPQLNTTEGYDRTIGPFTCSCLRCVMIEICADGDNVIPESDESDNCKDESIDCPASACNPDLKIEGYTIGWINRSDGIFDVTYTVANIGNGNAGNSTTRVNGANDTVPALSAGENYSGTAGPFLLSGYETTIEICADCYDSISESNEGNNCCSGTLGIPDLFIYIVSKDWADAPNRTYNINYTVCNYGGAESGNATVSAYIDGNLSIDTASDHPVVQAGRCVEKMLGMFAMTGDNDTIRLCVEWEGGMRCDESTFAYGGCLAIDGSGKLFTCGDRVDRSCTFTGDMCCDTRHSGKEYPHGLFIGADDITIDGCGYAMVGDRSACSKQYAGTGHIAWTGIRGGGYRNVTIRNLEIENFCNGICLTDADNSTIKDCNIHDNGAAVQYNCGVTIVNSSYTMIDGCSVSNNTGSLTNRTGCSGHGINFAGSGSGCSVVNSSIFHNYHSGIYAPSICKYLNITSNLIEDNGYCGSSDFCTGINLDQKIGHGKTTNSAVSKNLIRNNTGSGIRVAQGYTTIMDNIVSGCKNSTDVTGDGILIDGGWITFLYNNTACGNEGTDIIDTANESSTFGDDNTCDTTDKYNDEGTVGCIFYCGGANGVCVGRNYNFSCGMAVNESCIFNRSMNCLSKGGLIAGADGITIDGAGYTIIGNSMGTGIFSNQTNVMIKNLQVKGFSTGIAIENTTDSTIENCNLRKNIRSGINITADYGTVRNSRIYDNRGTGIAGIVVGGSYNLFLNNTVVRNTGYGIYFSPHATNNTINTSAIGDNDAGDINNFENSTNRTNSGDENTCDVTHEYRDRSPMGMTYGCTYPWTPPDLIITRKREEWVNHTEKIYNVSYRIKNDRNRSREAYPSITYLHIDDKYRCIAEDSVDKLGSGDTRHKTFDYEPKMSDDDDRESIWVCADGADDVLENNAADIFYHKIGFGNYTVKELWVDREANNCRPNTLEYEYTPPSHEGAACVADDGFGDAYFCGDTVMKSCTFNGSMECTAGPGLIIGADGVTIDGNGSAIIGGVTCADCAYASEEAPCEASGIYNEKHDGVKIIDLEVVGFCTGIALKGVSGDPVKGNLIEGCTIHGNGFDTESGGSETKTHGIHLCYVSETTIKDNEIYRNKGTGSFCDGGGNGIFLYAGGSRYGGNVITGNVLRDNDKAGFWCKRGMQYAEIAHNTIYRNGNGPGVTDDVTGGIVLKCSSSNYNTISDNTVTENCGDGMYIGGGENTISCNTVSDNTGNGINMGRSDGSYNNELYDNTVCGNKVCDIVVYGPDSGTTGDENTCDTTENYRDASVDVGCTYRCGKMPDLKITGISPVWVNPDEPDGRYKIAYTIANIGNADASNITVRIYVDGNSKHDMIISELREDGSNTTTAHHTFTMPEESCVEIRVCADHGDSIPEFDEDNNCMDRDDWCALPDLIVTEIDVPDEISVILPNDATATVANIGNVEAKGAFDVALFVNSDPEPKGTAEVSSNLAVGEDTEVTFTWTSAIESPTLKVVADYGEVINESNEENNSKTISVGENGNGTGDGPPGTNPNIYRESGIPIDDLIQPGEADPGEGVGGNWDYAETIGNESASGRAAKERVSAQLFRSNPFFGAVKEVVVSHSGITVVIALSLLLLFYVGFRGELTVHRRNNR